MNIPGEWYTCVVTFQVVIAVTAVISAAWIISWFLPQRSPVARERLWLGTLIGVLVCPLVPIVGHYVPAGIPPLALLPADRSEQSDALPDKVGATNQAVIGNLPLPPVSNELGEAETLTGAVSRDDRTTSSSPATVSSVRPPSVASTNTAARTVYSSLLLTVRGAWLVWMGGVLFLVLRGIRGLRICQRIIARSTPFDEPRFAVELSHICRTLGLTAVPNIVVSADVGGPMVMGVLQPRIVLPSEDVRWMSSRQLVQILLHESAHVIRRDSQVKLLQNLVSGLFWPHPLVYWLNGMLSQAREEVCDNFVLGNCEPAEYAETLLQMTERRPQRVLFAGGLAMFPARGSLERRIIGLLDSARDRSTYWPRSRRWAIQVALLMVPLLLGLVRVTTRPAHSAEPTVSVAVDRDQPAAPATAKRTAPVQQGTGRITGQVVLDQDGTAVAGAEVILLLPLPTGNAELVWPLPFRRAVTDGQGQYTFDGLAAGRYRLWSSHEKKLTSKREALWGRSIVIPQAAEPPQPVMLRLVPAGAVTVRVKERKGGRLIPNAVVNFGDNLRYNNVATNNDGNVTVELLGTGHWDIAASAPGFTQQWQELELDQNTNAELEFELEPAGVIESTVRDPLGKPISGVGFGVAQEGARNFRTIASGFSDSEGRCRLDHLPLDTSLTVLLSRADFERASIRTRLTAATQSQDFTLQPRPPGGTVVGQVVDEQDRPIAGAVLRNRGTNYVSGVDEVELATELRETTTGSDGRFRLENLYQSSFAGSATVEVQAKKFVTRQIEVKPGTSDKPVEMAIKLETGHRILGRTVNDKGRPLPGISISVGDGNLDRYLYLGRSGDDGRFEFDSLPNQTRLQFNGRGYARVEQRDLAVDTNEAIQVVMTLNGAIVGKVIDSTTGKAVRVFQVRVANAPEENAADVRPRRISSKLITGLTVQSAEGRFQLNNLDADKSFKVTVDSEGYSRQAVSPVLATRRTAAQPLEIRLDPIDPAMLTTCNIRLLDDKQSPVEGVQLRLVVARSRDTPPEQNWGPNAWFMVRTGQLPLLEQENVLRFDQGTTDETGQYAFKNIPKNAVVELFWWGDGVGRGRIDQLEQRLADKPGQPIDIVLPRVGKISGSINREAFPDVVVAFANRNDGGDDSRQSAELKPDQKTFEINALPPGKYAVTLKVNRPPGPGERGPPKIIATKYVTLEEGVTAQVDFGKQ